MPGFLMDETALAGEMQCRRVLVLVIICLCGATIVVGVTAAGGTAEKPLADAGLDQTVERGATVYLDAGGSVSPDGELVGFEWELERPDGTTITPACRTCERTRFQPTQTGVYNATVTITDDDGRSASDTLRVTVTESNPPAVTVSGPEIVLVGNRPTINLTATAGAEPLASLTWFVDGRQYDATFVDGNLTTDAITPAVNEPGEVVVEARVTDQAGRSATAEHTLTVEDGEFGVNNGTLVTRADKYDLSSLAVEFTGSTVGLESTPTGDKYTVVGERFSYSVGFRTYEEITDKTVINQPFTQRTAEFPHLTLESDPHEYDWWGREPRGIDTISMGPTGGTVEATNPVSSTSLAFWTTGTGETRIYGAQTEFEVRPDIDEGPTGPPRTNRGNDDRGSSNSGDERDRNNDAGRIAPSII